MPNARVSLTVLAVTIVSELIGVRDIDLGAGRLIALPLLYAFVIGLALNPVVWRQPWLPLDATIDPRYASAVVVLAISPLIARFGTIMGGSMSIIRDAGPALLVQEIGNLATVLVALPVAVLAFGMGREALGACFSIAREPNLAIISEKFGLKSAEGAGVMAVYAIGTVFGTIVFAVMASLLADAAIFDPRALAMACGVGSGSMMTACAGALSRMLPSQSEELLALSVASNLLTYATGLYAALFIALPVAERLYRFLDRMRAIRDTPSEDEDLKVKETIGSTPENAEDIATSGTWPQVLSNLAVIAVVLTVGNTVARADGSWFSRLGQGVIGVSLLIGLAVVGIWLTRLVDTRFGLRLPSVAWISLVAIAASLEGTPWAAAFGRWFNAVDVLATATPCLAYAGLAISRNEIQILKRSGLSMVVLAMLVFAGTYVGSAALAHLALFVSV